MANPIELEIEVPQFPTVEVEAREKGAILHEELLGRDENNQHPINAVTGLQSALNGKQPVIHDLDEIRSGAAKGNTALQPGDVPTVNDGNLTIKENGTSIGTFSANSAENKTINITVPRSASEVGALPDSTKYGASLSLSINSSTYVVTAKLKDQDGNTLGSEQTIDLPLESVVVNGSYDSENKKIILTLENGNTIDVPVGDLVAGLQAEITSDNKLSSDLVDDSTSENKFVSSSDKTTWNSKVSDAKIENTSIVNNGVAQIPLAEQSGGYGLVKLASDSSGLSVSSSGSLQTRRATDNDITANTRTQLYRPIVPGNLDLAIKAGLSNNSLTWTDAEKMASRKKIDAMQFSIFGVSDTAAATTEKTVSIPSITELNAGQIIIVTPSATSTVANSTIKLNNFPAYPMLYGGNAITTSTDSYVWIKDVPGWWLFDGSNWLFAGHGTDINTTYSAMSVANIIAGTETSARLMRSDYLKNGICGVVTAYASGDTITPADKYLYTSTADISALTINAPTSPDERYVSQINFSSGTTATTLSYPNTFKVIDGCDDVQTVGGVKVFVPVASKRYQMFILNDGVNNLIFAKGV